MFAPIPFFQVRKLLLYLARTSSFYPPHYFAYTQLRGYEMYRWTWSLLTLPLII
jgi:hypothetical protein